MIMAVSLKSENKSVHLGFNVTPTMERELITFAEKHGINKSEAARYIIALFLDDSLLKKQANSQKIQGSVSKKIVRKQVRVSEEA
jgi:hypothetical protein